VATQSQADFRDAQCSPEEIKEKAHASCQIQTESEDCLQKENVQIDCFKCEGNKQLRGVSCKRCKGTGKLSGKLFLKLHEILAKEVRSYCTDKFNSKQKEEPKEQVIHQGITCVVCETRPIEGIRYKCTVRPDFNICE